MNFLRLERANYSVWHAGRKSLLKTVKNHIYSGIKHKNSKKRIVEKAARERDLASYLQKQDKEEPAMVSMEERVYRIRVVEKNLSAGVPLSKIDRLRGLLEENGLRLTNSTHLAI